MKPIRSMTDVDALLTNEIMTAVKEDPIWNRHLQTVIDRTELFGVHLVVLVEPYLQYILEGKKTLESRFSINRIPPFEQIERGDVLLLKKSGGPILGICQINDYWHYTLDKSSWKIIRNEYSEKLCVKDPEFWRIKRNASYATLMYLSDIKSISPIYVKKGDRRGWVVLKKSKLLLNLK